MGRNDSLWIPDETDFKNVIRVGPKLRGLATHFEKVGDAYAYLNALTGDDRPSEDNKYQVRAHPGIYREHDLWAINWVWTDGYGWDNTYFMLEDVADATAILSLGIGELSNMGIIALYSPLLAGIGVRDSLSIYSLVLEPFAVMGGETLDIEVTPSVGDPYTVNVTLQAGDTTAALVAARINLADSTMHARDVGNGLLRVIAKPDFGALRKIKVKDTGTANELFGWPASGTETPDATLRVKAIESVRATFFSSTNVMIVNEGAQAAEISNFIGDNFSAGVGIYYPGGNARLFNSEVSSSGVAVYVNKESWAQSLTLSMVNTALNARGGAGYDLMFETPNGTVNVFNSTFDIENIAIPSGEWTDYFQLFTQAGNLRYKDRNAYVGSAGFGPNMEDLLDQLFVETRSIYLSAQDLSVAGLSSANRSQKGHINLFPAVLFTHLYGLVPTDRVALFSTKIPKIDNIGNNIKKVILIMTLGVDTPAEDGNLIKINLRIRAIDAIGNFLGTHSQELSKVVDLAGKVAGDRFDLEFDLASGYLQDSSVLRFEVEREGTWLPPGGGIERYTSSIYLIGVEVRL